MTEGVGSPGLAPEEKAATRVDENDDEVEETEEAEAEEAFCVADVVADWSLPARLPASLRARSSVWDIALMREG